MRKALIIALFATVSTAAGAANTDFLLKIEGVSRPDASGPIYLKVRSTGDIDGDGATDEGIVRLSCTGATVSAADFYNVKSPRDAATGQASGKRTHHPVTFVKEWGPASPQLRAMSPGYDLKKQEGIRVAADGWQTVSLSNADGLCPVAIDAVKATKSRSNIQNN